MEWAIGWQAIGDTAHHTCPMPANGQRLRNPLLQTLRHHQAASVLEQQQQLLRTDR